MSETTIQAKDLRIGNLVYKNLKSGQGKTLIDTIGCQDIVRIFEDNGSFNYSPIPLSEDVLPKLDFEQTYKSKFRLQFTHKTDFRFGVEWNLATGDFFVRFRGQELRHILTVHQLQNLFFIHSLTGEELKYTA